MLSFTITKIEKDLDNVLYKIQASDDRNNIVLTSEDNLDKLLEHLKEVSSKIEKIIKQNESSAIIIGELRNV